MEDIGTISAVIAAIAAVATLWFSVRNSKGNVLKRIERKEEMIHQIDFENTKRYGINGRFGGPITSLDKKKMKLQKEIEELRKKI